MSNKIDLNKFDVTVTRCVFLGGQIIGIGTYPAPVQKVLLDYALSQIEEADPLAYLSKNGDRVSPFVVMDDVDDFDGGSDDDFESMFKSSDEFGSMSDKKQSDYIKTVKEAPDGLSEEESAAYDEVLYQNLIEYKGVAKAKTLKVIEEVLSMYEDESGE